LISENDKLTVKEIEREKERGREISLYDINAKQEDKAALRK